MLSLKLDLTPSSPLLTPTPPPPGRAAGGLQDGRKKKREDLLWKAIDKGNEFAKYALGASLGK